MKRLYLALGAFLAFGSGAFAQNIDLESQVVMNDMTCLDQWTTIYPTQNQGDTIIDGQRNPGGIWGLVNNGPDGLFANDKVMFSDPTNSIGANGIGVYLSTLQQDVPANNVVMARSVLPVDSMPGAEAFIKSLLNIDSLLAGATQFTSLMVPYTQLQDGEVYGFYLYTFGVGDDPSNPLNVDPDNSNNFDYVPIKWHCTGSNNPMPGGVGIRDMMVDAAQDINIFPNPASNEINFNYGFIQPTKASVRVIDMMGRIVMTQDLGNQSWGTKSFTLNTANLANGNYLLQVTTEYVNGVGKFTVSK